MIKKIYKTNFKFSYLDVNGLPRKNNGNIDWNASCGCIIPFKDYRNGLEGNFLVFEYNVKSSIVKLKYKNVELLPTNIGNFVKGKISGLFPLFITYPNYKDMGISESDALTYTKGSNKKITVCCKYCNNKRSVKINLLTTAKHLPCICNSKTSYPEKFTCSILKQIGVEFETQLSKTTFQWCGKCKYDFYVPKYNMIIETHGGQHYEENTNFKMSLKEQQENDEYKKQLALANGIENYIELDCRKSELEWIKNSILNSKLNKLFDLDVIDWNKCEEFALSNLVKKVCNYWNNKEDWETTYTMAKDNEWAIKDRSTIINHLKKGAKLGWCDYNSKEEMKKNGSKNGKSTGKKCVVCYNDGTILFFDSVKECLENNKFKACVFYKIVDTNKGYIPANNFKKIHHDIQGIKIWWHESYLKTLSDKVRDNVLKQLGDGSVSILNDAIGDLSGYLEVKIEEQLSQIKNQIA